MVAVERSDTEAAGIFQRERGCRCDTHENLPLRSWDSSGVSDSLLKPLHAEINRDLDALSGRIAGLAQRSDLSSAEQTNMQELLAKWEICKRHAKDTIDVGQTDAAMATMMLGQTDDTFNDVDTEFQSLSWAISVTAKS